MATRKPARNKMSRPRGEITLYSRSVVRELCRVSDRELQLWEAEELIVPVRIGREDSEEAIYDRSALERIRLIRLLADDLDVNLPGIGIILHLLERMGR